jgi:hypothetical protein
MNHPWDYDATVDTEAPAHLRTRPPAQPSQDDWDAPFAPAEKTNVSPNPMFQIQEKPLHEVKTISNNMAAFPFEPMQAPPQYDPLEDFLMAHAEATGVSRNPLYPAKAQPESAVTNQQTPAVPVPTGRMVPLGTENFRGLNAKTFPPQEQTNHEADMDLFQHQFAPEDLLSVHVVEPALPTAYDMAQFTEPEMLGSLNQTEANTGGHSRLPAIAPVQAHDSLPSNDHLSYVHRAPIRENLGLPPTSPSGHTSRLRHNEQNFASAWESQDNLPAIGGGFASTSSADTKFIEQGMSVLNRFERVVLSPPGTTPQHKNNQPDPCASTQQLMQQFDPYQIQSHLSEPIPELHLPYSTTHAPSRTRRQPRGQKPRIHSVQMMPKRRRSWLGRMWDTMVGWFR